MGRRRSYKSRCDCLRASFFYFLFFFFVEWICCFQASAAAAESAINASSSAYEKSTNGASSVEADTTNGGGSDKQEENFPEQPLPENNSENVAGSGGVDDDAAVEETPRKAPDADAGPSPRARRKSARKSMARHHAKAAAALTCVEAIANDATTKWPLKCDRC